MAVLTIFTAGERILHVYRLTEGKQP